MAAKKKTMGRGLGSLLERRNSGPSSKPAAQPTAQPSGQPSAQPSAKSTAKPTASESSAAPVEAFASVTSDPNAGSNGIDASSSTNSSIEQAAKQNPSASSSSATNTAASHTSDLKAANLAENQASTPTGDKLRLLGIDQITRGTYQPRRHFDSELLQELAESLKSEGLIQPILVRPNGQGKYELIAGERRWRAAQLAGFTEIPSIVRELEDKAVAAVSLIENIQRKDLNPLEEAEALRRLSDEFGLSHQEVAESVGRSRSAVTNLMRLLDLHDDVKALVDAGDIDMGHARALLGAPHDDQPTIARRIAQQGLTVRAVEKQIKALRSGAPAKASSSTVSDPDIDRLEKHLTQKLGANVRIRHKSSGSGKLEINYHSMDELDGILNHIK